MTKLKYLAIALPFVLVACANTKPPQHNRGDRPAEMKGSKSMGPITAMGSAGLLIASFNRNDDYSINQSEFVAGQNKAFAIADNNKDNKLSPFELEVWRKNALGSVDAAPGNMFFDADFNQLVTRQEFEGAMSKIFQSSDRDGNGNISFDELVKIIDRPSSRQNRQSSSGGKRQKGGGRQGGGRPQR